MSPVTTRRRTFAALATAVAVVAATVVAAAPASAASTTITGRLTAPSGVDPQGVLVLAWAPGAKGADVTAAAEVRGDGSFTLGGLTSGRSYQLSTFDVFGTVASGYYKTSTTLASRAGDATLVRSGTTGLKVKAATPARSTDVTLVAPAEADPPAWLTEDNLIPYVVEPGNGRLMGVAGNELLGGFDAAASAGTDVAATAARAARAVARTDRATASAATLALPTTGLLKGGSYTLAFLLDDSADVDLLDSYFYGGVKRSPTRSLGSAGTFTGGSTAVEVFLLGTATRTPVSVSGTAKVGRTLTAVPATWSQRGSVSYQWHRNGSPITGATAATYRVQAADKGKTLTVRAVLRPSTPGYAYGFSLSQKTRTVTAGDAPTAKVRPTVTGTAKVGKKLTASPGTWSTTGLRFTYQWLRDGKAVAGATSSAYRVTSADVGKRMRVKVTAKRNGHLPGTSTSEATKAVTR